MSSWASSDAVRRSMQSNRPRDTMPERILRQALYRHGLRFRKHFRPVRGLRYEADIAFPGLRLAVFLDGCFWHGCPIHRSIPVSNAAFWGAKITRNRERDAACDAALVSAGWEPLRLWEHVETTEAVAVIAERVAIARAARTRPRTTGSTREARQPDAPP